MATAQGRPAHAPVLSRIADGNFHRGGLRMADLGRVDDFDALAADCATVAAEHASSDVTATAHVTNWTDPTGAVEQWSLYNRTGRTDDTSADFDYDLSGKHPIGYDAITALVDHVRPVNMRLNRLGPGAALSPHEEHLPFPRGSDEVFLRGRFHIPVATNPYAVMFADGAMARFAAGRLYFFNNGCVHSAANGGTEDRLHLVFDVLLSTEAVDRMFHDDGPFVRDGQALDVTEVTPPGSWARSDGMSAAEFDRRTLVPA